MNKENISKWVEALRSGEYKQTREVLHRAGEGLKATGFCCLGVACDISGLGNWEGGGGDGIYEYVIAGGASSYEALPREVREWLGVTGENPTVLVNKESHSLAELNDDYGKSFKQIANIIERNFLKNEVETE